MNARWIAATAALTIATAAQADLTVQASPTRNVFNCIPFGCAASYAPHMGFIYANLPAFTLSAGDILAFDVAVPNNVPLSFNIAMAATSPSDPWLAAQSFSTVVNDGTPANVFGDSIVGNYDLAYTVTSAFSFAGGGLMIDFNPTGVNATDTSNLTFGLVGAQQAGGSNPNFVGRYYGASAAGQIGAHDTAHIANFRIVNNTAIATPVPEPETYAMFLLGMGIIGFSMRRKKKADQQTLMQPTA